MRNNIRFVLFGVVAAAGLAAAPVALARSHWNVGINLGFRGVSIGYSDYGHRHGHAHGWGGNYYGGGHYGHGGHHSSYVSFGYYGPSWYGPSWYGPSYYSYPVNQVVYYDRRPVRRVHRSERRYEVRYDDDRGYRDDYANRATYYDRGDDYRR